MKVKKNDTVLVLTGKDAGKTGKVIASNPADNKIKVDGVNVQLKSKKARSANETSAIVKQVGAIDASNVLVVCPACGKATRVAYKLEGDKKLRVCKKCGASLDVKKAAPVKTAAKKTATDSAATGDSQKKPQKDNILTRGLLAFGMNPLFLYVMSEALAILFGSFGIKADIFAGIHSLITDDYVASLTYALFFVAIHAVMGVWMYHKKIFIKL